jgi:transcription antitermination protein NusB
MKPARAAAAKRAPQSNARLASVQALYQMELSGASAEMVLDDMRAGRLPVDEVGPVDGDIDQDLFKRIVESAVEHQSAIDTAIARALSEGWRLERIDAVARAILRAGVVELYSPGSAPVAVVIGEYVEIAKAFFEGPEPGFVNAALDACARANREGGVRESGDGAAS